MLLCDVGRMKLRQAKSHRLFFNSKTQEDAARAYDSYMKLHHPEFARLNFPEKA